MSDIVEIDPSKAPSGMDLWLPHIGVLSFLLILWGMLIFQLSEIWAVNPQYSYGYFVPFLCLFILWKNSAKFEKSKASRSIPKSHAHLCYLVGVIGVLVVLPLWIIREANADWRLLNVVLVSIVATVSLAVVYCSGGVSMVRFYLFAIFFFCMTIPWPLAWDTELTMFLQGKVSSFTAGLLNFMGYYAELQGNMIRLRTGFVGVDEACSGIRGLQSSFVVSLFLGHYYNLSYVFRALLVGLGAVIAYVLNMVRASIITWLSAYKGTDVAADWHDSAGITETIGIFVSLLIMVHVFTKIKNIEEDDLEGGTDIFKLSMPRWFTGFGISFLLLTLCLNIAWYNQNEMDIKDNPKISVNFADKSREYQEHAIADNVRAQLHYSEAVSATWLNAKGHHVQGFYSRWGIGDASPAILSSHQPQQCLSSRGLKLVQKHPETFTDFHGLEIPFDAYTFEAFSQRLYVFRCLWPDKYVTKQFPGFPKTGYDLKGRVSAAFNGERNTGVNMIVIAITGTKNFNEAKEVLGKEFNKKIKIVPS